MNLEIGMAADHLFYLKTFQTQNTDYQKPISIFQYYDTVFSNFCAAMLPVLLLLLINLSNSSTIQNYGKADGVLRKFAAHRKTNTCAPFYRSTHHRFILFERKRIRWEFITAHKHTAP